MCNNAVGRVRDALVVGGALVVAAQSPVTGSPELVWLDRTTLAVQGRASLADVGPVTALTAAGNVLWGVAGTHVVGYVASTRARIGVTALPALPPHVAVGADTFSAVSVDATATNLYASVLYGAGQWAVARYSATTGALQFVNAAAGSGPDGTGVLSAEPRGVWFSFPTGTITTSSLLRSSDLAAILTAAPDGQRRTFEHPCRRGPLEHSGRPVPAGLPRSRQRQCHGRDGPHSHHPRSFRRLTSHPRDDQTRRPSARPAPPDQFPTRLYRDDPRVCPGDVRPNPSALHGVHRGRHSPLAQGPRIRLGERGVQHAAGIQPGTGAS